MISYFPNYTPSGDNNKANEWGAKQRHVRLPKNYVTKPLFLGGFTEAIVTIPSTSVNSDLIDFPLMVMLHHLPASFWDDVDHRGGNVRVYGSDGATLIPHDVVECDKNRQVGRVFAKTTLSSTTDTVVVIKLEASGTSALASNDPNGREAVWSDYKIAHLSPDNTNRVDGSAVGRLRGSNTQLLIDSYGDFGAENDGVAVDDNHVYVFDSNKISKRTWADPEIEIAANLDPKGDASLVGYGGPSGGHVRDGELFVLMDGNGVGNTHVVVFDPTDLSYLRKYDLGTDYVGNGDLTWTGTQWCLTFYGQNSNLYLCPSDFSTITAVSLEDEDGAADSFNDAQAITRMDNDLQERVIVMDKIGDAYYVDVSVDPAVIYEYNVGPLSRGQIMSGLDWNQSQEKMITNTTNGAVFNEYVIDYDRFPSGRRVHNDWQNFSISDVGPDLTFVTTFHMEEANDSNRRGLNTVFNQTENRSIQLFRNGNSRVLGMWDGNSNEFSTTTFDYRETARIGMRLTGSASFEIIKNGSSVFSHNFPAYSVGSGTNASAFFDIGLGGGQRGIHAYTWSWVRNEAVSDDWLQADYDNWNDPASFYTIT